MSRSERIPKLQNQSRHQFGRREATLLVAFFMLVVLCFQLGVFYAKYAADPIGPVTCPGPTACPLCSSTVCDPRPSSRTECDPCPSSVCDPCPICPLCDLCDSCPTCPTPANWDKADQFIFFVAAENGLTAAVEAWAQNGVEIDSSDSTGATALLLAAQNGHTSTVEFLIRAGASLHTDDKTGATALIRAAQFGHVSTVEVLIQAGASISDSNKNGSTALICAAQNGHDSTVEVLLRAPHCDPNAAMKTGETALMVASNYGHASTVEVLLKGRYRVAANVNATDTYGHTALHAAVIGGHTPIVESLLLGGAGPNIPDAQLGFTPLHFAAEFGHDSCVDALLRFGANPNGNLAGSLTPLMLSVREEHTTTVKALLLGGADVNFAHEHVASGCSAVVLAAETDNQDIVELLLQAGANPNAVCNSVQITGNPGTALGASLVNEHVTVAEALLQRGADPAVADLTGSNALFYACLRLAPWDSELIREAVLKTDVNAANQRGQHALVAAVGRRTVVEHLLRAGADVNVANSDGVTPLIQLMSLAAHADQLKTLDALLHAGADSNVALPDGRTALAVAKELGHEQAVEVLRWAGAVADLR